MMLTALPSFTALFNVPMLSMLMIEHQSEYSLRAAAILPWRFIGITLLKSVIIGDWRQKPSPIPLISNTFR